MTRSEIYFLMKLVEKSSVPAWIEKEQLLITLQEAWIKSIHTGLARVSLVIVSD